MRVNNSISPWSSETFAEVQLAKFDYIVSNPPFKIDFSDYRDSLEGKENKLRFFAGIPKIPNKATDKMAIYTLFLQHIALFSRMRGNKILERLTVKDSNTPHPCDYRYKNFNDS